MDFLEKNCPHHNLPINNICTYENCDNLYLCDICLNLHNKEHKYIISLSSINNNIYEKIIEKNETNSKNSENLINDITKDYINKVESDFYVISEYIFNFLNKNKANILEKINNFKENYIEESKIWTKLKFDYSKSFLECINKNNLTMSVLESEIEINEENNSKIEDFSENLSDDFSVTGINFLNKNKRKNSINEPLSNLMRTINTVLDKELYSKIKNPQESSHNFNNTQDYNSILLSEFSKKVKDEVTEDFSQLRKDFLKISEEKIIFSNRLLLNRDRDSKISLTNNINSNNINNNEGMNSPKSRSPILTFNTNKITQVKRSPLTAVKEKNLGVRTNFISANSPYKESNAGNAFLNTGNNFLNVGNTNLSNFSSNSKFENLDIKKFSLETPQDIFSDKKGAWYTLEYIEDLDYVVCGFQTGEILIFKESDLTPVKTFRPRFKKIRKLLYSPENSSIFASYDDGYIVVIYLTNYKLEHFRMADSQIYSMEILSNLNILIFGGVQKKILFSHVINLNKVLLFYDSKEGEIQSLLYDDKRDILISTFRKNALICFKYSTSDIIFNYEFEGSDCCGMVIKKYKEDYFMICGYFLNLYLFRFNENGSIECTENINFNSLHLYDIYKLNENYLLLTTYDEGKLILVDLEMKKVVKSFGGFKGAIQMKLIKNNFYVTSHSESLKKVALKIY